MSESLAERLDYIVKHVTAMTYEVKEACREAATAIREKHERERRRCADIARFAGQYARTAEGQSVAMAIVEAIENDAI